MVSVSFGIEIALICGAVAEKNVRRQMRTDGRTAFQLYIYDFHKYDGIFHLAIATYILLLCTYICMYVST